MKYFVGGFSIVLAISVYFLADDIDSSRAMMAANIGAAKKVAAQQCASCHIIPGMRSKTAEGAPSFTALANDPDIDSWETLEVALRTSHWPEKDKALTGTDITNLTGYILSFKEQPDE